ncbi:ABC transporter [Paenibacillus odorifer]|uniref:ABC transporter n=1 Tax=Paenibacillus odorifer TaxID=189426 RepID=A0A1R0X8P6_9BACL|nr:MULTISPECIES: ABC transporter permease [Paenibacillus]ETT59662.1 ABC transporter [Paenibacillus sp. FSL H8-237]OMC98805.1 ABC transporter [Paenibacillus odorifer]OMD30994.1 ABC transporter [Paenibacillus odorifer]OME28500.1 ABC transporter [Paenibacillus odorifer]OME61593.1 ABC transporter [Paenibacillus odorifer]
MKWLHLFNANFRKEYIEMKRYLPNTIALVATFYIIFLGAFFGIMFIGDPASFDMNVQYSIVSVVFWSLTMMTMNFIGYSVITEATRGTLEQLYMSPMGVWKIMLTRIISQLGLQSVVMILLLFGAMLTSGQWLSLNPMTTIPIIVVTMISMVGVSFMIAGLAIIVKQIQAFLQIFQFVLMGLVFVPLTVAPFLAFAPFVKGVNMVRTVMLENLTLTQLPLSDYGVLFLNSLVYLILGLVVFDRCEKIAIKKGLLGQY